MRSVATSMSLFIALGYPVVGYVCIRILDLKIPKARQAFVTLALFMYLVACGMGTHMDQFAHLLTGEAQTMDDLSSPSHVAIMFIQVLGIAGIVAAVVATRARGLTLHITPDPEPLPGTERERYERELERLQVEVALLTGANEGVKVSVLANRQLKHEVNGMLAKLKGASLLLAQSLQEERELTPDEEGLVSVLHRIEPVE